MAARREELMELECKAMEEQSGISLDLLALGANPEQAYRGSSQGGSIFDKDDTY